MNGFSHMRTWLRWLIAAGTILTLASGAALALHHSGPDDPRPRTASPATAAPAPTANGGLIDHSVVDRPDLEPSADPSAMAVAAYGA